MPIFTQPSQARVTGIWGTAAIRGADGKMRPLKLGDLVQPGEHILTSQDGIVQLQPDGAVTRTAAPAATERAPNN